MTQSNEAIVAKKQPAISLDTWAVLVSLLAAILIRSGIIPRVPW